MERWAVKTGMDPAANKIASPTATTLGALAKIGAPAGLNRDSPRFPQEQTAVTVRVTLAEVKRETDSDYHLVITDGPATAVGEIPHPSCVNSGPLQAGIARARATLDSLVPQVRAASGFVKVGRPVTLTGVAFFDIPHGQTGEGPSDLELHPVTALAAG